MAEDKQGLFSPKLHAHHILAGVLCTLFLLRDSGSQGSTISHVVDCWVGDKNKALALPIVVIVHWPELATCPTTLKGLGSATLYCTWKEEIKKHLGTALVTPL